MCGWQRTPISPAIAKSRPASEQRGDGRWKENRDALPIAAAGGSPYRGGKRLEVAGRAASRHFSSPERRSAGAAHTKRAARGEGRSFHRGD